MNLDRFERAKEILLRVMDLPEVERKAILDQMCADDPELRAEVEELLAHDDHPVSSRPSSSSSDSATMAIPPSDRFTPGQILGHRYRIVRLLGRGGMGEVWQAYDLKLQVDVALKSIRSERFSGEQGLEFLRREVRSAREVMSPNVCRIFDLVEEDGQEFVSMEYVDGQTLLDILLERGPLELQEATRIASQFLSGLEAIHQAGLVHRDVKPENVMITRTGRVVLMDFGIAKGIAEDRRGTIAGTPAYMAPEQMRGESLDARADIFAAGVVLAEMGAPEGIKAPTSRESIWKAVRQTPVKLSESPWRPVLERAVSSEPSGRYGSARELARALEEVTLRVEGAEDKHPYPGLHSFTAADAEFFFGREVEVEAVWKKLSRSNLLAIIGPSGAGKTSFVQAGLLPAKPEAWRHVVCRPGSAPFAALGRALAAELAAGGRPIEQLLDHLLQIEDPAQALALVNRWGRLHDHALIVLDQFEELFTLCAPEVQARFADLLGRIAEEADVHVLLVMRDDFLFHCHDHPRLAPVTADLTLLGPPSGSALRRVLVQPALLCGYRFEDESLADEMITAIEGERGALPMLAFAAARLWENRDRERGLLTREAYERIGGVSGALAQHAEATLERIGNERQPIVREIFRNLLTAQGTRAVADVEELLSVFPDRNAAGEVLSELIDSRLLTSFDLPAAREDDRAQGWVEIVHESLLSHWPRLVRWQTQDADGAQLRDQLRQQARLWEERNRADDLLWTGSSYRDFAVWRERYPGGLSTMEEAFAQAMVGKAGRQRRRRQRIVAGTITTLVLIAAGLAGLWTRARVAQRRSEASKLIALGQVELDADPTAALAYAIAGLELADNPAGRRFALEALYRGPNILGHSFEGSNNVYLSLSFSPDGKRLALGGNDILVYSQDGSPPTVIQGGVGTGSGAQFGPDGDHLVFTVAANPGLVHVWRLSEDRETRSFQFDGVTLAYVRRDRLFLVTDATGRTENYGRFAEHIGGKQPFPGEWTQASVRAWAFDEGEPELIGRWDLAGVTSFDIDPGGRWVAYAKGHGVYLAPVGELASVRSRFVGEHSTEVSKVVFDTRGERVVSADTLGEIRLWSVKDNSGTGPRVFAAEPPVAGLRFAPTGTMLAAACGPDKTVHLWDLEGPVDADPVLLRARAGRWGSGMEFDPTGKWIATISMGDLNLWPAGPPNPYVLRAPGTYYHIADFTPDGRSLVATCVEGSVRAWSLEGKPTRDLAGPVAGGNHWMIMDPLGRFVVQSTRTSGISLVSLEDGKRRILPDSSDIPAAVVSLDGRYVVASAPMTDCGIRVWDLETGIRRMLEQSRGTRIWELRFAENGRLFSGDMDGNVQEWNIQDGTGSLIGKTRYPGAWNLAVTRDARRLFALSISGASAGATTTSDLACFDLQAHTSRSVTTHGKRISTVVLDPTETLLLTADQDGVVRVGPVSGGEPHMLIGPRTAIASIAVHPNGRWIAAGADLVPTVYLWRMPEGPPSHTLPRREFMDRLRARTNLRAIPDKAFQNGYRLEFAAFPGWGKVPAR